MRATAKQSLDSSEDRLLLAGSNQNLMQQAYVENKNENSRACNLLGVVLSISGLLLVIISVVLMNLREPAVVQSNNSRVERLATKEPISLMEVLTGELVGKSFTATWLIENQTGRDQLLFTHSGDLYLATLDDDKSSELHEHGTLEDNLADPLLGLPSVRIRLASNPKLRSINYQSWKLSPSRRFVLLAADQRQRFRSSFTAEYFIYDTKLDSVRKLKTQARRNIATGSRDYFGEQLESPGERPVRFQVADWFSGTNGRDSLLLAQDGDLYVLDDVSRRSVSTRDADWWPERLTFTGRPGTIYNGLADWPYEEQLTTGKPAYAISPSGGQYLAYFSFNDSRVSEIPMVLLDDNTVRPDNVRLRFPTAGTPISSVRLHMIENFADKRTAREVPIVLPEELTRQQHLIFYANWLTGGKLSLVWYNRHQSESHVLICSQQRARQDATGAWLCESSSSVRAPSNGWLVARKPPQKLNNNYYLVMVPKFEGPDVGEFTHVARVSLERPNEIMFLTSGRKEVTAIKGTDLARSLVYYTATGIGQPDEHHLYVIGLQLPGKSRLDDTRRLPDTCLTCDLYPGRHSYFEVEMSNTASHFILKCNGPDVPRIELRELLHGRRTPAGALAISSRLVRTIEDNQLVRDKVMRIKAMPVEVRMRLPIKNTDYHASVLLLLPPLDGFESRRSSLGIVSDCGERAEGVEQIARYVERMRAIDSEQAVIRDSAPFSMIVDVYGGPTPDVKTGQEYNITWGHWYASSRRTVYAWIEGRGSGLEGTRRIFELFGRLGNVEIEDQIQVTRDLVQGLLAPIVNPAQVGIWGWSYGGYAAGMVLARDGAQAKQASRPATGVFTCGASFGGVTDWLYYDTLFAEMILRSPWKNERYDRHTLGDHLLPLEPDSGKNQSSAVDTRVVKSLETLRDDVNDRYTNSSLIEQAEHIRGKRYLLVSGLADDNVHIQNTLRLTKRLVALGISFEMGFYPNQRHSMNYDISTRLHMHNRLADFFDKCFSDATKSNLTS